ncbi:hypothetical protein GT755_37535 [Herbidospora sp. NEAU-GS84]|uniref:Uncharacterized protein n=1 Tax=Herbidospora solisilvae TaxID=2696284 RepID=A0A7C9K2F0_9ACTN|nr:hypothetical protein [Herbidospora solisilvae]NAS27359.1 hypothetical protein [Herbidospora solisilvae]
MASRPLPGAFASPVEVVGTGLVSGIVAHGRPVVEVVQDGVGGVAEQAGTTTRPSGASACRRRPER